MPRTKNPGTKKASSRASAEKPGAKGAAALKEVANPKRDARKAREEAMKLRRQKSAARAALTNAGEELERQKTFRHNQDLDFSEADKRLAALRKTWTTNTLTREKEANFDWTAFQKKCDELVDFTYGPPINRLLQKLHRMAASPNLAMSDEEMDALQEDAMAKPTSRQKMGALNEAFKDMRAAGGRDPEEEERSSRPGQWGRNRGRRAS